MAEKIKVIMDCDPGIDDALAMAYLASNQDVLELLAITSVSGNQSIEKVTRNALDLAEFYGLEVPVAEGAHEPLVRCIGSGRILRTGGSCCRRRSRTACT